jgi:hypothetical protein
MLTDMNGLMTLKQQMISDSMRVMSFVLSTATLSSSSSVVPILYRLTDEKP